MKRKTQAILMIGAIIGYMIISNVVFYNMGQNNPHSLEGYRVREHQDEFLMWALVPIVDSYMVQGDPIHPARFMFELSTTSSLLFEVFTNKALIYSIYDTSIIVYNQEISSPQELIVNWQIIKTDCGLSCPIKLKIQIWEWMELDPVIMEII